MALIDNTFFTPFEPKQKNRFLLEIDGIQSFMIKKIGAISVTQNSIPLNYINVQRFVKGKTKWDSISMELFDPITPSGAQAVMEWVRLHHESITGRDGYSDFYKKDLKMQILGPVGDIVSEWEIRGALITKASFGDYDWDDDGSAQTLSLEIQPDYCVLNF